MTFYTATILLVWMALAILAVMVYGNDKISKADRQMLLVTYCLIAFSALAEWLGVLMDKNPDVPVWSLRAIKCVDFMLMPLAGRLLVRQLRIKNLILKIITGILIFNTVFQLVSVFTGWMIVVDPLTHASSQGPLYLVYLVEDVVIAMLIVAQFLAYGKSFRKKNRFSLYAILFMVLSGIVFQEVVGGITGSDIRTDYIAIVFGLVFLYIHFNGYSQQSSDDRIRKQEITIRTDSLTGLRSRYAYSKAVQKYNKDAPFGIAAFSIDINGLKEINDTLGHEAGDEIVKGAASCIRAVFGADNAFRTGGDEFIVLIPAMDEIDEVAAINLLKAEADQWHGKLVDHLSLSAGFALSARMPDASVEEVVREADLQMYAAKDDYYAQSGKKRRRN